MKRNLLSFAGLCMMLGMLVGSCAKEKTSLTQENVQITSNLNETDSLSLNGISLSAEYDWMPPEYRKKIDHPVGLGVYSEATLMESNWDPVMGFSFQLSNHQAVFSPNGGYELRMQSDGNLVLYRVHDHKALWASNTTQPDSNGIFLFKIERGAWIIYKYISGNAVAIWNSGSGHAPWVYAGPTTNTSRSEPKFYLQNDGNIVMYIQQYLAQYALAVKYRTNTSLGVVSGHFGRLL